MKKSLRPQQTAPVQRQTAPATSSLSPVVGVRVGQVSYYSSAAPFAGDDAE